MQTFLVFYGAIRTGPRRVPLTSDYNLHFHVVTFGGELEGLRSLVEGECRGYEVVSSDIS